MARALLIVLGVLFLAGCGGEEVVSPTGPVSGTLPKAQKANPAAGKQVFASSGCGSCHTLQDAGASGKIGPNLDNALKGKDETFIKESITDPNKDIAQGYQPNIMPATFKDSLTPKQIDDLVAFLTKPS